MNKNDIIFTTQQQQLLTYNTKSCSICFENFTKINNLSSTPCYHVFHCDCIKKWLVNHKSCPICKSYSTVEKLTIVPQSINLRLIKNEIQRRIEESIKANNLNALVEIIEDLDYIDNITDTINFLNQYLIELIKTENNSQLASILQKLLTNDFLSGDKYRYIYHLFKKILKSSIQESTNIEAIKLLLSYDLYSSPEEITSVVNKYFAAREFNALIDIIKKYGFIFTLNKNILKQVIKEDIQANKITNVEKLFNILTMIRREKNCRTEEISELITDLLELIERLDDNKLVIDNIQIIF